MPTSIDGRTGSAALLAVFALVMAVGLVAWMMLSAPDSPQEGPTATRDAGDPAIDEPALDPGIAAPIAPLGMRAIGGIEAGEAGEYAQLGKVFNGTGSIVGEIQVDPGSLYPERWTLTLEPSRAAQGSERAITRVIESEPGQRTFELRDLPMAAYRIHAEAPGMATMAQEVALYKVEGHEHLPGVNYVNATLRLHKAAFVDGALRTSNGDVADDVPVFLVDRRSPDAVVLETRTDIAGLFRWDVVRRGAWLLYVGDAVRPLVAPVPVEVAGTPIRLNEVLLPPLATLNLVVVDEYGRPFPDVDLVGYLRGAGSGAFRTKSDALGRASVRYLTPGPWRINANYELEGQKGKADIALSAGDGPDTLHEIHIR